MDGVSLFSGVGGLDLGFLRAGIRTVLQVECDPWCLSVLAHHWPDVERLTDVRALSADTYRQLREAAGQQRHERWPAEPDLVYGGFPCQDTSLAGSRAGLRGEHSGFWFEFQRVLSELRPRWAVIENVLGLLSSAGGRDFGTLLAGLDELGFNVAWTILDAQHFGVPQRRRRMFVVAGPARRACEQILAICESCGGHPETSGNERERIAGTITAGTHPSGFNGRDAENGNLVTNSLTSHHGRNDPSEETFVIASTIQSVRRLTPLECERLQGFPDYWTLHGAGREIPDSHRYRMLGNAVCVPVAEWIGWRLTRADALLARQEAVL